MSAIVWIIAVDVLLIAPITAWLATQKDRSPSMWFVLAAVAGPVALLAVGLSPAHSEVEEARRPVRRCPECDSRVSAVAVRCPACRAKLAPLPEPLPEPPPEPELEPESVPVPAPDLQPATLAEPPREAPPKPELEQAPEPDVPAAAIVTHVTRRGAPAAAPSSAAEVGPGSEPEASGRGAQNLATGVFAGGATELVVGYRYLIGVTARQLRISGPVDVAPDRVVLRAPRNTVEAAALGNDIVIGADPSPGRRVQLAFRGVAGGHGNDLVAALDRTSQPAPKRTRRSRSPAD